MEITSNSPLVSVIIPTMASSARAGLLKRAVESIRGSSLHPVHIITVVNGDRFDTKVCEWLKAQPDIEFEYLTQPSAPGAVLRGREMVNTEFFSTLDDDDEYLPDATDKKLAVLKLDSKAELVVGNYFQHCQGIDTLRYSYLADVPAKPLESMMSSNWLHNCNALFRSSSVGLRYFRDYPPYGEWTYMAFRLALDGKNVAVLDLPVARCYEETPDSLSKSKDYFHAYIPLFERMLKFSPPSHVVRLIQRKISASHHDASVAALRDGLKKQAFFHHLQSLRLPGGLRYLAYTRYFFK